MWMHVCNVSVCSEHSCKTSQRPECGCTYWLYIKAWQCQIHMEHSAQLWLVYEQQHSIAAVCSLEPIVND